MNMEVTCASAEKPSRYWIKIQDHFLEKHEKQGPKRYEITDWPSPSFDLFLSSVVLLGFANGGAAAGVSVANSAPAVSAALLANDAVLGGAVTASDSRVSGVDSA